MVAAVNDLSGFGKCSLSAALPILSVLGVQAVPLPTAILTNQTGFDSYFIDDYTDKIDTYIEHWQKINPVFDGIYTGFLANEAQVNKILKFIDSFKNEDTLLLVDPVMGDNGSIYSAYTPELCNKMKLLVSKADVITPNLTEACLLAERDFFEITFEKSSSKYLDLIQELGNDILENCLLNNRKTIIITGIEHKNRLYNAVITKEGIFHTSSDIYGIGYSGTGDIFASIICGYLVQDLSVENAVVKATKFIEESVKDSFNQGIARNYGVNFEKYLYLLLEDLNYGKIKI